MYGSWEVQHDLFVELTMAPGPGLGSARAAAVFIDPRRDLEGKMLGC